MCWISSGLAWSPATNEAGSPGTRLKQGEHEKSYDRHYGYCCQDAAQDMGSHSILYPLSCYRLIARSSYARNKVNGKSA
jgi:hypothetical protein